MRKTLSIVLSILTLGAIVIATSIWLSSLYYSVLNYRSPLADALPSVPRSELIQSADVVLVIVSGLGNLALDTLELPNLTQIAQTGARAVVQSTPPTYSQTARITLITGAPPEANGAPPIDLPIEALGRIETDTIFAQAHRSNLRTALVGQADWRYMLPDGQLDASFFVDGTDREADNLVFENALLLLNEAQFDLLVIHFSHPEYAAGTLGEDAYRQALTQIDGYLAELYQSIDLGKTVLIVVGDHGHTAAGGYGGSEPEVTQQPLIMTGQMVIPGEFSDVSHVDVAPTVAALLGTSPPAITHGRALFEMLRLDETTQALHQIGLAYQQVALLNHYVYYDTGEPAPLSDELATGVTQAEKVLAENNIQGAYQLARLAQENANSQMKGFRHNTITAARWLRLGVVLMVLLIWGTVMWRRRGPYTSIIVVAVSISVGLYHVLYQLQGYEYSISSINDFVSLPYSLGQLITVSLLAGGGLILIMLLLVGESSWARLLGTGYGYSVLVTFVFALPLFWAFWQNGFVITNYLPDVDAAFWQVTALIQTRMAAILGLFLPWPIMLLILLVVLLRRSLHKTPSRSESDALPGLHL